jgi:hypothetical protein
LRSDDWSISKGPVVLNNYSVKSETRFIQCAPHYRHKANPARVWALGASRIERLIEFGKFRPADIIADGATQMIPLTAKAMCMWLLIGAISTLAQSPPTIWTQHDDNARTGGNTNETILRPSNVEQSHFGKLFSYRLDDQTFSQPLYVPGVPMSVDLKVHNVVFAATVNNTVYAWDADSNTANSGQPLWTRSLTPPGSRVPNAGDMSKIGACNYKYNDFAGNIGIVGSPVIDPKTHTLYVVARTVEGGDRFVQRLHALDITSGDERPYGPKVISASYNGVDFEPQLQNQRAALALVNGVVYIAWASHCDFGGQNGFPDYHGWIVGYSASDLSQTAVWNDTAYDGGSQGGIWQAGQAVTADERGNLYLTTGNGSWDGANNFGMSVVRLSMNLSGSLRVSNFFTPWNYLRLNNDDMDLGSAGVMAIPGTNKIIAGGKDGILYLIDCDNMGGITSGFPDNVAQEFQATFPSGPTGHIHGSPIYYNGGVKQFVYLWGENDFLRAFEFTNSSKVSLNSTPAAVSQMRAPQIGTGMPGGFLSSSSNGQSNGIVWALAPYACDANQHVQPGIVYAFDASSFVGGGSAPTLKELWDSREQADRDDVGYFAKFTYPTVANGKVYVSGWGAVSAGDRDKCGGPNAPSNQGQLTVYGLIN